MAFCSAGRPGTDPVHVLCGTGDHLWVWEREPVDSPATVTAMVEWMARTYKVGRMYWRGGQSHLWDRHVKLGPETPLAYDWAAGWKRHLYRELRVNEAAVAAAKRFGMEIFLYTGLFELGVQPDVGVVEPYLFEDELRRMHPGWCPVDRWGERRCPGPISFCYPEARRAVRDRLVRFVLEQGYDGINFYTYVENCGLRTLDEFGFNQPIVDEFRKRFPDVDLRADKLTDEQRQHWYRCRGVFVTQFLRELKAALAEHGRKLSMILDATEPGFVQPWWGKPVPGTGMIALDWEAWIDEGIVDELWVQLGPEADQTATLDRLLAKCEGTSVKLTVRTPAPFDAVWDPYRRAGVTPIAVITWARNGIEKFSLEPTGPETLGSPDWRLRLQTLADIEAGGLKAEAAPVARMTADPHVLVRRRAVLALAAMQATDHAGAVEACLDDEESSVRIAAAAALGKVNGPASADRILAALRRHGRFQMKLVCAETLAGLSDKALPSVLAHAEDDSPAVREVCVRALYATARDTGVRVEIVEVLRRTASSAQAPAAVRYWAIDGLTGLRAKLSAEQRAAVAEDWLALLGTDGLTPTVELHAAWGLGYLAKLLEPELRSRVRNALARLFHEFGDDCARADAAFGWRVVGNALLRCGGEGKTRLEAMRTQTDDRWLAWVAYQVVHVPLTRGKIAPCSDEEAVETHRKYAPPFPGYRTW